MPETIYERWLEPDFGTPPPREKRFDPHQLRDPHTGEWVHQPGGPGTPKLKVRIPRSEVEVTMEGGVPAAKAKPGVYFTGTVVPDDAPDQPLYHVSANAPAVEEDGYLTVGKGGGLGAFGPEKSVSFTTNEDLAKGLEADMKRNIRFAQIESQPEPPSELTRNGYFERTYPSQEWKENHPGENIHDYIAEADVFMAKRAEWSKKMYAQIEAEAGREGFTLPGGPGTPDWTKDAGQSQYSWGDWVNYYYGHRPESLGGNPVFIGLNYDNGHESQRERDPNDIKLFTTTLDNARSTGALITAVPGLEEMRVFGDVAV